MIFRPSTWYYKLINTIYRAGFRPRKWSPFYSDVLEKEAKWRNGEW